MLRKVKKNKNGGIYEYIYKSELYNPKSVKVCVAIYYHDGVHVMLYHC